MLRIAVPNKGTLSRPASQMLREAGYRQRGDDRDLVCRDEANAVEFFYLRPRDIATYVGSGDLDLGITGRDLLIDAGSPAREVLDLDFAAASFRFAARPDTITGGTDVGGRRIATVVPGRGRALPADNGLSAEVIRLDGAVENAIRLGVADVVADVVETGATLRQAGLTVVGEPILRSSAVLIGRADGAAANGVEQLVRRLQGVLVARRYVMLVYDVRADRSTGRPRSPPASSRRPSRRCTARAGWPCRRWCSAATCTGSWTSCTTSARGRSWSPTSTPAGCEGPPPVKPPAAGPALALVGLGGVASAGQSLANAELGARLGAPVLGAVVNNLTALVDPRGRGGGVAGHARRPARAARRGAAVVGYLGGFGGALFVVGATYAVPVLGVAVFTIAQVAGSSAGGLAVDRVGLGPTGRLALTVPRVAGALLGIGAVAIAQLGRPIGDLALGAVLLAVAGGLGVAIQTALNGRVSRATSTVAGLTVNMVVSSPVVLVIALAAGAFTGLNPWPGDVWLYLGGPLGLFVIVTLLIGVQAAGVLRTGLAIVAGQLAGAILLDLLTPGGPPVGPALLAGSALTFVAVAISGCARPRYRKRSSTRLTWCRARARGPALEPHRAGARGAALPDPVPHGAVRARTTPPPSTRSPASTW